ncbi:MAG: nuclear transport factor 2 family protein [Solirubrobacterales bacterium]
MDSQPDSAAALERMIARYNEAWNAHDLEAIIAMHAPDMVFENHTAGERAAGPAVREHIASIFDSWPDLRFETVRLYARDGVVTQEWRASATHTKTVRRSELEIAPTGETLSWAGVDVIPTENGLVKRKDVYSDSVGILRQLGILD